MELILQETDVAFKVMESDYIGDKLVLQDKVKEEMRKDFIQKAESFTVCLVGDKSRVKVGDKIYLTPNSQPATYRVDTGEVDEEGEPVFDIYYIIRDHNIALIQR
jgi:hypothetical protein